MAFVENYFPPDLMQELKLIPLPELFDMLVDQTAKYLGMVHMHGNREDLEICRELMTAIQLEIERRKSTISKEVAN